MPIFKRPIKLTFWNSYHPIGSWLLLLALAVLAAREFDALHTRSNHNDLIQNPASISANLADLPPEVIFARARHINREGDFQQALRLYLQIEPLVDDDFRTDVKYNMGTVYLQQAAKLWNAKGVWEYGQINTLLDLAEQAFKEVLSADPEHWSARYNLEFALRIRPPAKEEEKADWQGHKSSVHAIMPGLPEGGP